MESFAPTRESFAPTRESFAITRDEDDTALKAVEVDMPHDDPPHKPKRFTHMLLDILGQSQRDLSVEVGRSKCYSFFAVLTVAALLGSMVAANIAGYELVKDTEVNDDTLKTRDGNTVRVALVEDEACPLVELLEMTREELAAQKLVYFSAVDGAENVRQYSIKVADTAVVLLPSSEKKIEITRMRWVVVRSCGRAGRPDGGTELR